MMPRLEFRMPMSPSAGFYRQARLFRFALDRLGGDYEKALLTVTVGDNPDMEAVMRENTWSKDRNVRWLPVPRAIFDEFGIHGTADYRYIPASDADIVLMVDADTVLVRPIDDLLDRIDADAAVLYGHMAHYPPTDLTLTCGLVDAEGRFWAALFNHFGIKDLVAVHPYSMDVGGVHGLAPPYFNLGFLAMTQSALAYLRANVFDVQRELMAVFPTHMRCQFAVTIIGLKYLDRLECLGAQYNLANDDVHFRANRVTAADARLIHYLRETEFLRMTFLDPDKIEETIQRSYVNAASKLVAGIVADYSEALKSGNA